MGKEIIINAEKDQTRIAIVQNGELAELYFEDTAHERTLGDIYLGRVRRIMPSIQAAFVDIGQKQDAFLHFSDLAENLDELLELVDQQHPEVSTLKDKIEHHETFDHHWEVSKRRRPQHGTPSPEEGETPEKHHSVADAQTRGKRRSAQQRSTHKSHAPSKKQSDHPDDDRSPQRGSPDSLKRNQRILVKIIKEPISNKGSRVSSNISLAGRFLVLVPLADYTAVSKKITSPKERRRLRALAKMLLPEGFGVIVRTVAQNKDAKSLDTDLRLLLEKWRKIEKKLDGRPEGPMKVHEDVNMASSIIRDLFSNDYDRILVDHPRMYRNIKNYIQAVAPQMAPAVQMHKTKKPIFIATKIQRDVDAVFESRADLPSGGYLFIERTEAMHVIDVNSGRSGRGMSQEENSLKVNLESARAIARQVRLRDLGGIIVIDFIDMREERNKRKVYDELRSQFRKDRAVTKILPMSDFGLIQITRQRLRPSITTTFSESYSNGANTTNEKESKETKSSDQPSRREPGQQDRRSRPRVAPEELIKELEQWLATYKKSKKKGALTLRIHPFTAAYMNRKMIKQATRWYFKYKIRVQLDLDKKINPMTFRFIDTESGKDVTRSIGRDRRSNKKGRGPRGKQQNRRNTPVKKEAAVESKKQEGAS